jgi:putative ABC transport system substrate-binding protein
VLRRFGLTAFTLTLLAAPLAAEGQSAGRVFRIGILQAVTETAPSDRGNMSFLLPRALQELGYVEGRNLLVDRRFAGGQPERLVGLARGLAGGRVDLVVAIGNEAVRAARDATRTIPIVMLAGAAVTQGLVASLAQPGGNVTGLSGMAPELEGKRLELFTQAVPQLSRVVALLNPANPFTTFAWKALQPAAEALGVQLQPIEVQGPNDLDRALATIKEARPDGLIVVPDRFLFTYRASIVQFMAEHRLPGMFPYREFVQEGGLLAYGPDYTDMYRRAATYVDKILRGAKPADLPMEQPTKFELVINLKTAKALGITVPHSLLLRADQVIQ